MDKGTLVIEKKAGSACRSTKPSGKKSVRFGADGCASDDHSLANILKAIAHPVRIRILRLLAESEDSLCSCEIEAQFPLRQPTISHHMKTLKETGLVESWQEGNWVHYILSKNPPIPVREIIQEKQ